MHLIPAIDLIEGRCVRLLKGDYSAPTHYDIAAPELLAAYRAHGAAWVHIVDLDGARDGIRVNHPLIATLAGSGSPRLQVGGGLRDAQAVEAIFDAGASRAVIGSAALADREAVIRWIARFGADRIALALDVRIDERGVPRVATHGWTRQSTLSLWEVVESFLAHGLRHILCTDVGRDGALTGPNLALYKESTTRFPQCAWQASGGVRDARDLRELAATGVDAAISGKALLEKRIPLEEISTFSPSA